MIRIQTRDQVLLKLLERYGLLSTQQIGDILFRGVAHTTVMRRLRKLESLGLILRRQGLPDFMSAWCLTQEAGRLIGNEKVSRYANQNVVEHEVTLSGVRMALEGIGLGEKWTTEINLRRRMGYTTTSREELVIPDGLFVAKRQGKPCVVAVELELHAKGHARYDHILDSYAGKSSIGALWYIVPQHSIAKTVLKRLRNISDAKFTLISSLLEEIVRDPANARVLLPGGESIPLCSYFQSASNT